MLSQCASFSRFYKCKSQFPKSELYKKLVRIENIGITILEPDSIYSEKYEIMLTQNINHSDPQNGKFSQRILLSHKNFNSPTVMITEGYSFGHNYCGELAELLKANEIRVEHRYFGKSKPDSMEWQYLTIEQAVEDHHNIVNLFKTIYPGKWINTGWSKGGQTSIFHRYFYPKDVDISVIYDAPLNFALEDKRIDEFFENVGSKKYQEKIIDFQKIALSRKDKILPLFKWFSKGKGYEYSIGLEKAFEYIVLEYPFSFWQYNTIHCDSIPNANDSSEKILNHLKNVVAFSSYSYKSMNSTSMFQFSTQLGYYGYVTKNVKQFLSCKDYPNSAFAPQVPELIYNPEPMQKVNSWLQDNGNNMIFIYGSNDPWSAPSVEISEKSNSLKIYLEKGNHFTFINTFPIEKKQKILNTIENWLTK